MQQRDRSTFTRVLDWLPFVLISAIVLGQYVAAGSLPYFSEDYTQIAAAERWQSWTTALDPDLVPLRPLQHLFTFWEAQCGVLDPSVARLPGFLMHLGSCYLVFLIARQLGLSKRASVAALLLYSVFPNYKSVVWTAAIALYLVYTWLRRPDERRLVSELRSVYGAQPTDDVGPPGPESAPPLS